MRPEALAAGDAELHTNIQSFWRELLCSSMYLMTGEPPSSVGVDQVSLTEVSVEDLASRLLHGPGLSEISSRREAKVDLFIY